MRSIVSLTTCVSLSVEYCLSKLNNSFGATQWNRHVNTTLLPVCTSFLLIFLCLSVWNRTNICSFRPKQSPLIKWGKEGVYHPRKGNCAKDNVFYSETTLQTSLHVTQACRLHRSPVSRDVINYTYIDRNNIHYSWAPQRQTYFPPFQHDEKILNNRPPLQTSAFQRSRLTLKRLKSELLSYRRITAQDQHVSNCWWLRAFRGRCFCFVFVWRDKSCF